jgi:hypothetical protein
MVIRLLKQEITEHLRLGLNMPPEEYFAELHQHVQPYAFASATIGQPKRSNSAEK